MKRLSFLLLIGKVWLLRCHAWTPSISTLMISWPFLLLVRRRPISTLAIISTSILIQTKVLSSLLCKIRTSCPHIIGVISSWAGGRPPARPRIYPRQGTTRAIYTSHMHLVWHLWTVTTSTSCCSLPGWRGPSSHSTWGPVKWRWWLLLSLGKSRLSPRRVRGPPSCLQGWHIIIIFIVRIIGRLFPYIKSVLWLS